MTNLWKRCIIRSGVPEPSVSLHSLHSHPHILSAKRAALSTHFMIRNFLSRNRVAGPFILTGLFTADVAAQSAPVAASENSVWMYVVIAMVVAGLGAAILLWRKSRKGSDRPQFNYDNRYRNYHNNESYELEGLDADKELEWLRKAKKSTAKPAAKTYVPKKAGTVKSQPTITATPATPDLLNDLNFDTKIFQEKMRKLQYSQLPINSFHEVSPAKIYEPLPLSNDPSLINAIDQANEEFEEDETVRDLAVRILTAFRMRNSVEALAQIALYDLSSNLRSKAVSTLTDFDHDSVFETILLACADPTREVRAAAARGLFRLNFDRADAWKRIVETNDEFRMSHAARAAIESGIVVKSFDRLVHEDLKVAYEAFTLVSLLIRSGETASIFDAIKGHKDERVRFALLHVIKVNKDERTLAELHEIQKHGMLPTDVSERVRDTINSFEKVTA